MKTELKIFLFVIVSPVLLCFAIKHQSEILLICFYSLLGFLASQEVFDSHRLFEEPFRRRSIFEKNAQVKPFGLANLGNTCFLNSALTALSVLSKMNEFVQIAGNELKRQDLRQKYVQSQKSIESNMVVIQEIAKLFSIPMSAQEQIIDLTDLRDHLSEIANFEIGVQQDANEALFHIFQILDTVKAINLHSPLNLLEFQRCRSSFCGEDEKQQFGGSIVSQESNLVVHIDPRNNNLQDLLNAVTNYFAKNDAEKNCSVCDKKHWVDTRMVCIGKAPEILYVQISRFLQSHNQSGMNFSKNDSIIQCPEELDIPFYNQCVQSFNNSVIPDRVEKYTLRSFIIHEGQSIAEGHYISVTKDSTNQWWVRNDDLVSLISKEEMLMSYAPSSYLLFYELSV